MNILIVTRSSFLHGDATSAVIGNLAKALISFKCNVKVLSFTGYKSDEKIHKWDGIRISNEYLAESKLKEQLKKEFKTNPIATSAIIVKKALLKIYGRINSEYRRLSLDPVLTKSYQKILLKEIAKIHYDLCLITLMPHEAVWAMNQLNIANLVNLPYVILQYDTYWNQECFPDRYKKYRLSFERMVAEKSMFVMTTPQIVAANNKTGLFPIDKYIPSEFPMVVASNRILRKKKDEKIHCVFVGRLYADIRPPEKIVNIISKLNINNIMFDFYGAGQNLITESKSYHKAKGLIKLYGVVESREAKEARYSADVLVNIDNTNLSQVPSKIFEYISTCKPIINFYFNENSPLLAYLKNYPLCLNINVNRKINYNTIILFIKQSGYSKIPFDIVHDIFIRNTPEYVAKQLMNAFCHFSALR